MRLNDVTALARTLANEPGLVTPTQIAQFVNLANRELYEEIAKTDQNWFERRIEIPVAAGSDRVNGIANLFNSRRVMDIWWEPATATTTRQRRLTFRPKPEFGFIPDDVPQQTADGPIWYTLSHQDLLLVPPAGESGTLHVRYTRPWTPMATAPIASFPTNREIEITIASTVAGEVFTRQDIFSGATVRLLGNTAYHGQEFECVGTVVTPTTYTLTVAADIPAAIPPLGDVEILTFVPSEYHEMLAHYAAHILYGIQRNTAMSAHWKQRYEEGREKFIQTITKRRRDGPDGIVYAYDPFDKPLIPW